MSRGSTIPPLHRSDGTVAQTAGDEVNLLAKHFTEKMCVPDPERPPPTLPDIVKDKLLCVTTSEVEVQCY